MKKRVLIKLGTNILTTEKGSLDVKQMQKLIESLCKALKADNDLEILMVSSGAITCGADAVNFALESVANRQAAAAIGQILLMSRYEALFKDKGYRIAQILISKDGLAKNTYQENIVNTVERLIKHGVIPIFNENDCVATDEIGDRFGDNDELSGLIARFLNVDRLVILSDTLGLYDKHPGKYPDAQLITEVHQFDDAIMCLADDEISYRNRGGMAAKLKSAYSCTQAGIDVVIACGRSEDVIYRLLTGEKIGTYFKKRS